MTEQEIRELKKSFLKDYLYSEKVRMLRHNKGEKEFAGYKWELGEGIDEALIVWKFISDCLDNNLSWDARREVLSQFIEGKEANPDHNDLVGIVAMLESLPDSVWRKLIWKENIDFASREAFLRRLTEKQKEAICNNYKDFCVGKVPRVFNGWNIFWNKISIESLLAEEYDYNRRFASKGSWVSNFLGLDMGFSLFPNGKKDDTLGNGGRKFLAKKNHVNDFVVNKEDGLYYWLYQTARNSYLSGEQVFMKSNVCPGFWYTMIIHLIFWFVSPSLFVFGFLGKVGWVEISSALSWSLLLLGSFTPGWLILAGLKGLNLFRWSDVIEKLLLYLLLTAILSSVGLILFLISAFLENCFGLASAIFYVSAFVLYVIGVVYGCDLKKQPEFDASGSYLEFPLIPKVYFGVAVLDIVGRFLLMYGMGLLSLVINLLLHPFMWLALVLIFSFFVMMFFDRILEGRLQWLEIWLEANYDKAVKWFLFIVFISVGASLSYCFFVVYKFGIANTIVLVLETVALLVISFFGIVRLIMINPIVKKERREFNWREYNLFIWYKIRGNKYIQSLDASDKQRVVRLTRSIVDSVFSSFHEGYNIDAAYFAIMNMNSEMEAILKRVYHDDVDTLCRLYVDKFRFEAYKRVLLGENAKTVVAELKEKEAKYISSLADRREMAEGFFIGLFMPITAPFKAVWWLICWMRELLDFGEFLREVCPQISRSDIL